MGRVVALRDVAAFSEVSVQLAAYREAHAGVSHTARAKSLDLDYIAEFATKRRALNLAQLTPSFGQAFSDWREELGEAPATVNRRIATLKHFLNFIADRTPGFLNPSRQIRRLSVTRRLPQLLAEDEVREIRSAGERGIRRNAPGRVERDTVVVELLLRAGLRSFEMTHLRAAQVVLPKMILRDVRRKARIVADVPIAPSIRDAIEAYAPIREQLLRARGAKNLVSSARQYGSTLAFPNYPLVVSVCDADIDEPASFRVSPKTVHNIIARVSGGAAHPHLLRHQFGRDVLDATNDLRLTSLALGHRQIETTMIYVAPTTEQIQDALSKLDK